MKPIRARRLAKLSLALAALLAVALPMLSASRAEAQFVTKETRCRDQLATSARRYLDKVLKARIRCENRVIIGALPLVTDCLSGVGDEKLLKSLRRAEDALSNTGADCNGVNLQLLGFPGVCPDNSGYPFDTGDFQECVVNRTAVIVATLLDYYYPPITERMRDNEALCLQGTPEDAATSLSRKMRARQYCLIGQEIQTVDSEIDCRAKILPYGPGTGNEQVDRKLARAYVALLGEIPVACADIQIDDLDYQSTCPDETGGVFTVFDLKTCLFDINRLETLEELLTVFPVDAVCGDGIKNGTEECDLGVAGNSNTKPDTCRTDCTNPECGDSVKDPGNGETCDDGNTISLDCCSGTCVLEVCGDGVINCGEECDNGANNGNTSDKCRATTSGFAMACDNPRCGDGITDVGLGETCDDGNLLNGDDCSSLCKAEQCGDEIIQPPEECDDGDLNANEPDKCRATTNACTTACNDPECGDCIQDTGEECDDGNSTNEDGCDQDCQDEFCGDGIIQEGIGEECDNGVDNADAPDACRATGANACKLPRCGDGITDPSGNETCDDGNTNNTDGCPNICGTCGDGKKQSAEPCDGDSTVCPGGEGCTGACSCEAACPTEGELVLYAGIGDFCSTNVDCPVGVCDQTDGRCHTVTRLDSGWAGGAFGADINNKVVSHGFLECEGHGPTCGECAVTGINPDANNCRCANNNRAYCNDPFSTAESECPACVGGNNKNTQKCGSNTDCLDAGTCPAGVCPATNNVKVCSTQPNKVCTTNADCTGGTCPATNDGKSCNNNLTKVCATNTDCSVPNAKVCSNDPTKVCTRNSDCPGGTCPTAANALACGNASKVLCDSNSDCSFQGSCTGQSGCTCYFGAPFPLSSGGTPACIVNRFAEDISGTANVDLGAGEITAKLRTGVFLGYETRFPCATCGGTCSNSPATFCDRDEDCSNGGTCDLDDFPDDGIRGGVCGPGSTTTGQDCDVNGRNSSFPAYTSGPGGGAYSIDCLPSTTPLAGQGLGINLTQTTGTSSLPSNVSCGLDFAPELMCPCLVCSADQTIPCNTHEECDFLPGSCSGAAAITCEETAECEDADVGPCIMIGQTGTNFRCEKLGGTFNCNGNSALCQHFNVGTCNPPTCSAKGEADDFPQPNNCTDQLCSDDGSGVGKCTTGPDAQFCAGVVTASGLGVLSCQSDAACTMSGVDARPCSLFQRSGCFFDPVTAIGTPDPSKPIGAATFCIPPVSNDSINAIAGLPGPGRILNQAVAKTFCGNDTDKQYIPGVGGCLPQGLGATGTSQSLRKTAVETHSLE